VSRSFPPVETLGVPILVQAIASSTPCVPIASRSSPSFMVDVISKTFRASRGMAIDQDGDGNYRESCFTFANRGAITILTIAATTIEINSGQIVIKKIE